MKSLIVTAILLLQIQAFAADPVLSCAAKLKGEYTPGSIVSIKLDAQEVLYKKSQLILKDVKVSVDYQDYETQGDEVKTATGVGKLLEADLSYKPTKYKNHSRLSLTDLEDPQEHRFGYDFRPSDQCAIEVLIPDSWGDGEGFYVPVLIHCDQSGGFALMECQNL